MELFVKAVNTWKALLTIVTKSLILDVVRVIGLPPNTSVIAPFHKTLYGELFELYVNYLLITFSLRTSITVHNCKKVKKLSIFR